MAYDETDLNIAFSSQFYRKRRLRPIGLAIF